MVSKPLLQFGHATPERNLPVVAWWGWKQLQCDRKGDRRNTCTVVSDANPLEKSLR